MREGLDSPYGPVPGEEQRLESYPMEDLPLNQYHQSTEHLTVNGEKANQPQAQLLGASWLERGLRLVFDLAVAFIGLLFAIFGIWVYRIDGSPAGSGIIGSKLFKVSQYAPTVFPVLFAAIVGGSLKSIASWRIQTSRGANIRLVQQCLGSQTISGAFMTQIRLRAFNDFAIFSILLWCLSPLGSQASLRVISIVPRYVSKPLNMTTINTFTQYHFGYSGSMDSALTMVANPVIASISAASLLGTRNQDIWGNIRLPMIENLQVTSSGWMDVPQNNNLTYPSLIGIPVAPIPTAGNTSFTLTGSYISISCPVFGLTNETRFEKYRGLTPENDNDCAWVSSVAGTQYKIAISQPCVGLGPYMANNTRNARMLLWESISSDLNDDKTWASCILTTTYVDANTTCTGSLPGTLSPNTCEVSTARRSLSPQLNSNWTVLDIAAWGITGPTPDAGQVLSILTGLFPYAQLSGGMQAVHAYLPIHIMLLDYVIPRRPRKLIK